MAENTYPAVRWVAPATDSYTVSGQFTRIDTAPHATNVRILQNNSIVLFSSNNFNDTVHPVPFTLANLHLTAWNSVGLFRRAGNRRTA